MATSILKVVSGGQTGVDRAALDAAMRHGIAYGGWCPRGRRAEDGLIPDRYRLAETPSSGYLQRTRWNVRDSDGTLILFRPPLEGGTLRTRLYAEQMNKPFQLIDLSDKALSRRITEWLEDREIKTLNVAGPRESGQPGVYDQAILLLDEIFSGRV